MLTPKGRREHGHFIVEGPTMLAEALASGVQPKEVYATTESLQDLPISLTGSHVPVYIVSERTLARFSDVRTPPGILAVLPSNLPPPEELFAQGAPILLLAGIADPGNAGTLLRSAEIFGVSNVVFGANGVETHNPKVVRSSMGAIFRLRLAMLSPEEVTTLARSHGYTILATSVTGTPIQHVAFPERPIFAVGNERRGVASWLPTWDKDVSIPQKGNGESLNAAVAGSIILYVFSQQSVHPSGVT